MEEKRTRLEILKEYVDSEYHKIKDPFEKRCAFIHSYGVSFAATLIAAKRGENIELAAMAGLLHDFYLYFNANDPDRTFENHAQLGAIFVKEILEKLSLTTSAENDIICCAITNHSDKTRIDNSFDETIKDAELIQKCLYDIEFTPHPTYKDRYPKLAEELGLSGLNF